MRDETFGYVTIIALVVIGGLYVVDRLTPQQDPSQMVHQMSGPLNLVGTAGSDRGIIVRQEVIYTNQPALLRTALLQSGGGGMQQPVDPAAALFRSMGWSPGPSGGYHMPDYHLFPDGSLRVKLADGGWSEDCR